MKCVHTFGTCRHKRQADITLLFQYIYAISNKCNTREKQQGLSGTDEEEHVTSVQMESYRHSRNPRCRKITLTPWLLFATKMHLLYVGLLVILERLCSIQCEPRSDCSSRSSLIWINTVCLYAGISI